MTNYQWVPNSKPDRPGIWWNKTSSHPRAVSQDDVGWDQWPLGTWAFICDLPDIKDPPKYRDVTAADVGREIEVFIQGQWRLLRCFGVSKEGLVAYEGDYCDGVAASTRCRILDDGQPKREPREGWVNIYRNSVAPLHPTKESADECSGSVGARIGCIRVREVID